MNILAKRRQAVANKYGIMSVSGFPTLLSLCKTEGFTLDADHSDPDITYYEVFDKFGEVCGSCWCHHKERQFGGEVAPSHESWLKFEQVIESLVAA